MVVLVVMLACLLPTVSRAPRSLPEATGNERQQTYFLLLHDLCSKGRRNLFVVDDDDGLKMD